MNGFETVERHAQSPDQASSFKFWSLKFTYDRDGLTGINIKRRLLQESLNPHFSEFDKLEIVVGTLQMLHPLLVKTVQRSIRTILSSD